MIFVNTEKLVIPEGEVIKIMHGSTILWKRPGIPLAYQQVEYIQADGNQAIDTGVMASDYPDGLEYVFEGNCTSLSGKTNNYLFGCLASGKRSANVSFQEGNATSNIFVGGAGNGTFWAEVGLNVDFVIRAKGTPSAVADFTATYNNSPYNTRTSEIINTDMPPANIYLLACNLNGNYYSSASAPFTGKLYSFTMSDMTGMEIRHFIPCYRKADGVIGLYDTVGNAFYTNLGTGSFTKGANV